MTEPTPPQPANIITEALIHATENIAPIFESAKGIRARLINDGWSPPVAEIIAADWLRGLIRKTFE